MLCWKSWRCVPFLFLVFDGLIYFVFSLAKNSVRCKTPADGTKIKWPRWSLFWGGGGVVFDNMVVEGNKCLAIGNQFMWP